MAGKNIEAGFRSVCKTLFGREVGGIADFEPYLKETLFHYAIFPSAKSGKGVPFDLFSISAKQKTPKKA